MFCYNVLVQNKFCIELNKGVVLIMRVNVSLNSDLVKALDFVSKEYNISRSALISYICSSHDDVKSIITAISNAGTEETG